MKTLRYAGLLEESYIFEGTKANMIKKLCILFIVVASIVEQAKGQITFPMQGADWHFMVQNGGFFGPYYYTNTEIKYTHDTLFMGKTVRVLNTTVSFRYPAYGTSEQFIYTSGDSVFFYNSQTLNKFQILYNFGSSVGQGWQIYLQGSSSIDTINVKVDSIKNTLINSVSLKTLYVTYTGTAHQLFQIENHSVIYDRIGDINYLFNFTSDIWSICDGCSSVEGLLCYQDNTFSLYQPDTTKPCNYNTTGISQISGVNTNISIYPNPNNGLFVIEPNTTTKQTVMVYDVTGKQVLSQTISGKATIDASALYEGVYNISISNSEGVINKRLVIVK